MIDMSKIIGVGGVPSGIDPVDYWSEQGLSPWKETGYGGGKVGIGTWTEAGQPIPKSYPTYTTLPSKQPAPMPGLGDDVRAQPAPSPSPRPRPPIPDIRWDPGPQPPIQDPNWTYDFDYRGVDPVDYWTERHGLHPWKQLGFGQLGRGGFAAWEQAGMPIPSGYPMDWAERPPRPRPPITPTPTQPITPPSPTPTPGPKPPGPTPPTVPPVPMPPTPSPPTPAPPVAPPPAAPLPPGAHAPYEEFPFPPEWDIAGRTLAEATQATPTQLPPLYTQGAEQALQMAQTGIPTAAPQAWTTAEQGAQQMLEGGMPVDIGGWWEAQQPEFERTIKEQSQQAAEEAGLTGLRWSSPLQRQITDITGREASKMWADLAGRDISAQEAARERMMGTVPQLTQLGAGQAGLEEAARARQLGGISQAYQYAALPAQLEEAAKGRALSAAGGLGALGGQYAQLPMNVAAQSMQMGLATQQAQQQQINAMLQEFMRTLPETSPWLQLGMGATQMPFQATPQMYQPSGCGQLLSGLGGGLGAAAGLGWQPLA